MSETKRSYSLDDAELWEKRYWSAMEEANRLCAKLNSVAAAAQAVIAEANHWNTTGDVQPAAMFRLTVALAAELEGGK